MADRRHVDVVKKGRDAIAAWRETNPHTRLNLIGANLGAAHLRGAHLGGADLSVANLGGADLRGADLRGADLSGANLRDADLAGVNMGGANLVGTDLRRANLAAADLIDAKLVDAVLVDTNLDGAGCGWTTFAGIDLSRTKRLEGIRHRGPSTIGVDTLFHSRGKIPDAFLRGAGVPDVLIEYLGSLTGNAFEFYSCFISYSSVDDDFAERLYADLQHQGVRCWFAPQDLKIGDRIRVGIDEAIRHYERVLLVLSKTSIQSQWVEQEVETALERERKEQRTVLLPIRVDDGVMDDRVGWASLIKNTRNIGDFTRWREHDPYTHAFKRLLRDLQAARTGKGTT